MFEQHYFTCACSDFGHTIRFNFDPQDGELYLDVHLYNWEPWYKRVWVAVLYVFKKHKPYGHYDCTLLRSEDFARLHSLLDRADLSSRAMRQAALNGAQENRC
jgi:hypothetical protein